MARVTVEDCLEQVPNQYDLVILAKERTLQIGAGDAPLVEEDNDKKTVISLREIGDKKIDPKKLIEATIDRARDHPEDALVQEDFDADVGDAFEEIYKVKYLNLVKQSYHQNDQEKFQHQTLPQVMTAMMMAMKVMMEQKIIHLLKLKLKIQNNFI